MIAAETARQFVHIAMGGFAFALRWLTWWQAAACALAALLLNLIILPRVGRALFRQAELERRLVGGILFYPLAILLLVLTFRDRPDITAAAWGILAVGDGAATIVGRAGGTRRLPWNPDKSWAGTLTFVLTGGAAATILGWWTRGAVDPPPPAWFLWTAPALAAVVAALVETLPVKLDDNLSVPAAAAATLWACSTISPDAAWLAFPLVAARLAPAVAVNAVVALAGYRAGTVTPAGAVVGFLIGVLTWLGAGGAGWTLLLTSFLLATATSRIGLERKMILGIAEARGGRRGPANALANCSLATLAALLVVVGTRPVLALLVFVTALVAGASDTVASEVGKAFGRTTRLVTTLRRVAPGTPGALSFEGTVANVVAALGLAVLANTLGLIPAAWILVVTVAAVVGSVVESGLGATLEGPGVLDNDMLNFLNTAVASVVAVVLARSFA